MLEQQILNAEDLYKIHNLTYTLDQRGHLRKCTGKVGDEIEVLEEVLNKAPELDDDDQQYKL